MNANVAIKVGDSWLTAGERAKVELNFSVAPMTKRLDTVKSAVGDWHQLSTTGHVNQMSVLGAKHIMFGDKVFNNANYLVKSEVLENTWLVGGVSDPAGRFLNGARFVAITMRDNPNGEGVQYKTASWYKLMDSARAVSSGEEVLANLARTKDPLKESWSKVSNHYTIKGLQVAALKLEDISVENGVVSDLVNTDSEGKAWTVNLTPHLGFEQASNTITVGTGWADSHGNSPTKSSVAQYAVSSSVVNYNGGLSNTLNQVTTDGDLVLRLSGRAVLSSDSTKVIEIYKSTNKLLVERILIEDVGVYTEGHQRRIVVDLSKDLVAGDEYFVHISQGAFTVDGMAYMGINDDKTYQLKAVDENVILHKIYQHKTVTLAELSTVISGVNMLLLGDYQKAIAQTTFTNPKGGKEDKDQMLAELEDLVAKYSADLSWYFADKINPAKDISNLDVSLADGMLSLFYSNDSFNQDIGNWDVGNVKVMSSMFSYASNFNQDIGHWDVANVEYMDSMFRSAHSFNQDIGNWDVSNVTRTMFQFYHASTFNQDIGGWDVGNVKQMSGMFKDAYAFNQDIGGWDVSHVTGMSNMFEGAKSFDQNISGWDVSRVKHMEKMFAYAHSFNQNIGNWNVAELIEASNMFVGASAFNTNHYDLLLAGWSDVNASIGEKINKGVKLGVNGVQYSNATARQELLDNQWVITDAGLLRDMNGNGTDDVFVGQNTKNDVIDKSKSGESVTIHSLGGDDVLIGSKYKDYLHGGAGSNTLTGGEGGDLFVYSYRNVNADVITDFSVKQGDKLDFDYLLDGYNGKMSEYVKVTHRGNDTILQVDIDGYSNFQTTDLKITLKGVGHLSDKAVFALIQMKYAELKITNDALGTVKTGEKITYTFTFNQAVNGFGTDDIVVTNGQVGHFHQVSNSVYTAVVTPLNDFYGNVTVDVAASAVSVLNGSNNSNTVATHTQAVYTKTPSVKIKMDPNNDGTETVVFTFNSQLATALIADVNHTPLWSSLTDVGNAQQMSILGLNKLQTTNNTLAGLNASHTPNTKPGLGSRLGTQHSNTEVDTTHILKSTALENTWIIGGVGRGQSQQLANAARYLVIALRDKTDDQGHSIAGTEYTTYGLLHNGNSHDLVNELANTKDFVKAGWKINHSYTATGLQASSFGIDDIRADGGTLSNLTMNPSENTVYTAKFTPNESTVSTHNKLIVYKNWVDFMGNEPTSSTVFTNYEVHTYISNPSLNISNDAVGVVKDNEILIYTFTFSQKVIGFDISDITLSNATAWEHRINQIDDNAFILFVQPNKNFSGNIRVSVAANAAYSDDKKIEGHELQVFYSLSDYNLQAVDTKAPIPVYNHHMADASMLVSSYSTLTPYAPISLRFNEKVKLSPKDGKVIKISDKEGHVIEIKNTNSGQVKLSDDQQTISIRNNSAFIPGETYQVSFSKGAVTDLAGNDSKAITGTTYQFSAVKAEDILNTIYHNSATNKVMDAASIIAITTGFNAAFANRYQHEISIYQHFVNPTNATNRATMIKQVQEIINKHSTNLSHLYAHNIKVEDNIQALDTSLAHNMSHMFDHSLFNVDIATWDVSKVTNMSAMFNGATAFNQNISCWDVSNVSDMSTMFSGATAFNQNIGDWDISSLTKANDMFKDAEISTENYDALLAGWADVETTKGESIQTHVKFGASNAQYTNATVRQTLLDYHWEIDDAGLKTDHNSNDITDVFVGDKNNDHIDKSSNIEGVIIHGLGGSDRLEGSQYDDLLYGGKGQDVLIGNAGADTFVFTNIREVENDFILDFDATEGDILDLSLLLDGYHDPLLNPHQNASNYIKFSDTSNSIGGRTLYIDPTGSINPLLSSHKIILQDAEKFDLHQMILEGSLIL